MTKKIFRSIFAVALTVFLACLIIIMGALYEYFSSTQMNQLKTQTELAAAGVELSGTDYLNKLSAKDYRITLIESDGTVIFDSSASTATMENHLQRAEIKEALANGFGQSTKIFKHPYGASALLCKEAFDRRGGQSILFPVHLVDAVCGNA